MKRIWIGWSLCGLVIAFLLLDAIMKIIAPSFVLEAGQSIGFPGVAMNRGLGLLLLVCTLLYIVPRTAVVGAILVTAYLGGAVATHVRLGHPLFSHVLFGVYVGILLWGGLVVRLPNQWLFAASSSALRANSDSRTSAGGMAPTLSNRS